MVTMWSGLGSPKRMRVKAMKVKMLWCFGGAGDVFVVMWSWREEEEEEVSDELRGAQVINSCSVVSGRFRGTQRERMKVSQEGGGGQKEGRSRMGGRRSCQD